ncbi:MAG TPA: hypothetical protein PKW33_07045 [Anaerolineaceae bacterium]|nr:hypothetical protein [Anaerolineaceae bacterium]HPN51326.1 hypothetical protein [Anaerolineaceae bacterium]
MKVNEGPQETWSIRLLRRVKPWVDWLIVILLLGGGLLGWLRLRDALSGWDVLAAYLPQSTLVYLAAGGGVWLAAGFTAALAYFFRLKWGPWAACMVLLGFTASFWLERLLMMQRADSYLSTPLALTLSLVAVCSAYLAVALARRFPKEKR